MGIVIYFYIRDFCCGFWLIGFNCYWLIIVIELLVICKGCGYVSRGIIIW